MPRPIPSLCDWPGAGYSHPPGPFPSLLRRRVIFKRRMSSGGSEPCSVELSKYWGLGTGLSGHPRLTGGRQGDDPRDWVVSLSLFVARIFSAPAKSNLRRRSDCSPDCGRKGPEASPCPTRLFLLVELSRDQWPSLSPPPRTLTRIPPRADFGFSRNPQPV